jgi:TetR/AcrR family transcriptional regulator, regulator of cefoperazone and chloramphenicol sensitivity
MLVMRPTADFTARVRTRDAAMRLFADQGEKSTTIRAVAEQAGVAPGLVSHHFGSKQGLRDACDDYVLDYLRQIIKQGVDEHGVADPAYLDSVYRGAADVLRYVARALVDSSAAAAALFDNLVALTEEYLTTHPSRDGASQSDARTQAAVIVAMRLGVWVLHPHLMRALGADELTPQMLARLSAAVLDVMSQDFAGADIVALARSGLDRYLQATKE